MQFPGSEGWPQAPAPDTPTPATHATTTDKPTAADAPEPPDGTTPPTAPLPSERIDYGEKGVQTEGFQLPVGIDYQEAWKRCMQDLDDKAESERLRRMRRQVRLSTNAKGVRGP